MTTHEETTEPRPENPAPAAPAAKPKPAGFDYAGANQSHLKSMSAMRGRSAGPMKKAPPRR